MSDGVEECSKRGLFAKNIAHLVLENVKIEGQVGEAVEVHDVDRRN
jgi:hypothetical protein